MQGPYLRKRGNQTTINFQLYNTDGKEFKSDANFEAGDVKIMKDEGDQANTTYLPTDEGQGYSLILAGSEMQAARIVVYVADQTSPKVWLDTAIVIETYGTDSAQHSFDLDKARDDDLLEKAAKVLVNKAVQDKLSGEIDYYDDDGQSVILTHTPSEGESQITRAPS